MLRDVFKLVIVGAFLTNSALAADMTEEQKQQVLVAMSCPCCGGSGMALTIPLDGSKPVF